VRVNLRIVQLRERGKRENVTRERGRMGGVDRERLKTMRQ
jgi:hypothetical protein